METDLALKVGGAIATALLGAIGVLWRMIVKHSGEIRKELDDCRGRHEKDGEKIVDLSEKVARLEERDNISDALKTLNSSMLEALKDRK